MLGHTPCRWLTFALACTLALTLHARPIRVLGEGAEPLPERSYSNAAVILELVVRSIEDGHDCSKTGTLSDALGILYDLADEPLSDPASRARCAALLVPLLTNQQTGYDVAVLLQELPSDFVDTHHAELRPFLAETPRDFEDVIGVYAMLPSCDVTFATNKAHQMQSWLLMRDAILARHGDHAALERLKDAAKTFGPQMGVSDWYLARVLSLVRTKAMVEFLMAGLRAEDVIEYGDGMTLPRNAVYQNALWRMFRNEPGGPAYSDYLALEEWSARMYGIPLPKERLPRKDVPHTPVRMPARMQPEGMHP